MPPEVVLEPPLDHTMHVEIEIGALRELRDISNALDGLVSLLKHAPDGTEECAYHLLKPLGLPEIPVILCDEWTEAQVKAFRLLANRSVAWAEWDEDLLKLELEDLKALDFDLGLTGFDNKELEALLSPATTGLTDEDAVPETPKVPTTVSGDVWVCGPHRLMCDDSTIHSGRAAACRREADMVVADPPYGVELRPKWREGADWYRQASKEGTER